jgi:hypothetical protein
MANNKMSYQEASRIRNSGLLSLIAKNKFQQGQSLGKSIKSAIGSKLKARVTGIKEIFDPLNLISSITGSGVIGKSIRTLAGRAMGKSDEDIQYFGGYARRNRTRTDNSRVSPRNGNSTGIKVEKLTRALFNESVSDGQKRKMQKGDGLAEIMAKIYNVFKNGSEEEKLHNELDRNFKKQKEKEKDKWNDELIKAITGSKRKKTAKTTATQASSGMGLLSLLALLYEAFKIFKGVVDKMIKVAVEAAVVGLKLFIKSISKVTGKIAEKLGLKAEAKTVESVAKETEKGATKTAEKTAVKTTQKVSEKTAAKAIEKSAEKTVEKTAAKSLLKKIPLIGLGAGLLFAAQRLSEGDVLGAGLEVASGAASMIPVVGTAMGFGIDAGLAASDLGAFDKKEGKTATPVPPKPSNAGLGRGHIQTSSVPAKTAPKTIPKAAPLPPQSSDVGKQLQSSTSKNIDLKNDELTSNKTVVIDNSKNVAVGTGGGDTPLILDGSVDVRIDDTTLNYVMKQSLRPI